MSDEPEFLTLDEVHAMHAAQLARWGGSDGVRDPGAIDSALAQAKNAYFYRDADLYEIAATYAFHIAESQGYVDGNKRTGVDAALTFLALNGHKVEDPHMLIYEALMGIADHTMGKPELANLLRTLESGAQQ